MGNSEAIPDIRIQPSERMLSQDMAKGLCMLLVIAYHVQYFFNDLFTIQGLRIVGLFISCLMPFFFFLIGYNYKSGKRSPRENIKKRFKQMVKPFIQYTVGMTVLVGSYLLIFGKATLKQIGVTYLRFLLSIPLVENILGLQWDITRPIHVSLSQSWFLVQTLVGGILFYLIADYALKKMSRALSISIGLIMFSFAFNMFIPFPLPWNFQNTPAIVSIMLIGALFGKYRVYNAPIETKKDIIKTTINMVAAQAIVAIFEISWPTCGTLSGGDISKDYGALDLFAAVVTAICGSYVFVNLCKFLEKIPPIRYALLWVGRRTIPFLMVHKGFAFIAGDLLGLLREEVHGTGNISDLKLNTGNGNIGSAWLLFAIDIAIIVVYLVIWEAIKKAIAKRKEEKTASV